MKRITLLILGGAMLSSFATARDGNADFKAFMNSTLPKLEKAFESMDLKFFDQISTPDFVEKMGNQTTPKAQAMAQMKQQFAMTKSMKCNLKLLSSKVTGNTAIAMTYGKMVVTSKPQGKQKAQTMNVEMWEKETWVKSGKSWKIKMLEEAKPMKMTPAK